MSFSKPFPFSSSQIDVKSLRAYRRASLLDLYFNMHNNAGDTKDAKKDQ